MVLPARPLGPEVRDEPKPSPPKATTREANVKQTKDLAFGKAPHTGQEKPFQWGAQSGSLGGLVAAPLLHAPVSSQENCYVNVHVGWLFPLSLQGSPNLKLPPKLQNLIFLNLQTGLLSVSARWKTEY